jgi:hypothetical protein
MARPESRSAFTGVAFSLFGSIRTKLLQGEHRPVARDKLRCPAWQAARSKIGTVASNVSVRNRFSSALVLVAVSRVRNDTVDLEKAHPMHRSLVAAGTGIAIVVAHSGQLNFIAT